MTSHAILSPSSADRWMSCPGSLWLSKNEPDNTSEYAKEGTVAHALAAYCLTHGKTAESHIGMYFTSDDIIVDDEMAEHVQIYIDTIKGIHQSLSNVLIFDVEQGLEFTELLDLSSHPDLLRIEYEIDQSFGTADVVILGDGELQVHDLKYGKGVRVDAEDNKQLMIYALAAYYYYSLLCDINKISVHIHQPRLNHYSSAEMTVKDLMAFGKVLKEKAAKAYLVYVKGSDDDADFSPGEKQCRFCKAAGRCKYLAKHALELVANDFVNLNEDISTQIQISNSLGYLENEQLANTFKALELVESWCKAVKAKVHSELQQGNPVPGFKLVTGRPGNRAWSNEEEAETTLKSFRLKHDEMYKLKLISPTQALKITKSNPEYISRLKAIIVRPEGKPTVVPESDKRSAITIADDFKDLTKEELTNES